LKEILFAKWRREMKKYTILFALLTGMILLAFEAVPALQVSADTCGGKGQPACPPPNPGSSGGQQIPGPKNHKPTPVPPTVIPSPTPIDTLILTANDTQKPQQASALVAQPVCPNPVGGVAANSGSKPPGDARNAPFFPLLLGGGGLLGGLLAGLLVGISIARPRTAEQTLKQRETGKNLPDDATMTMLQRGMDSNSNFDSIASNLLKEEQDTQDALEKNIKD
jgi:hypothetical protein